ncbi:protein MAIN-LIKE 1-like [Camellia sinensis]|uniref:protein MAIN-LIKE 1-like n=1 Tax=Camellia sinensis TaxID=4442 RepID=UPI0010360DA1|nr:protein MAIN-LIKE 1-like [Camellia sinensis]
MVGLIRSPASTFREEESIDSKQQGRSKEEGVNRGKGLCFERVDEFDGDEPVVNDIDGNEEQTNIPTVEHHTDIPDVDHPMDMLSSSEVVATPFLRGLVGPSIPTNFSCHVAAKIWNNEVVVSTFVERWQPETNSFHMPFGEMFASLDDVSTILGIPMTGTSVSTNNLSRDEAVKVLVKLLGVSKDDAVVELKEAQGQLVPLEWLHENFQSVSNADSNDFIHYAARAYLLLLLGCTLFVDKTTIRVSVVYLKLLEDLNLVHSYAWGAAALAFLYKQLGMATKSTVRQIAGYMTLLEAWIYEHFICLLQEELDRLEAHEVIWDPYISKRDNHPFAEVAYYTGLLKCIDIVEPYHPDRFLRQFGRMQTILPPPLSPVS